MRVQLRLQPYRLPLARPWRSARGLVSARTGWLVCACERGPGTAAPPTDVGEPARDGHCGYGDCAPLPTAGTETAPIAAARLRDWCIRAARDDLDDLLRALATDHAGLARPLAPAADCAVETALLDLCARQAGLPLRRLLAESAVDRIAVNAMPGTAIEVTPAAVAAAVAAGYRVLKLKVGIGAVAVEAAAITRLATALPAGVRLRLDANGAWGPLAARQFLGLIAGLPIDAVEEPLAHPDDAELARLQAASGITLALDESLAHRPWPIDCTRLPMRRLVLKPGVIGGLRPTLALARRAIAAGHEVVLTSLVESAAGLWASAQLAAALPGGLADGLADGLAHGLGTADWLATDLGAAPVIAGGMIALPAIPGSGFVPAARQVTGG